MIIKQGHCHNYTGWGTHLRNTAPFNILKKFLLVLKQTILQQKALEFGTLKVGVTLS